MQLIVPAYAKLNLALAVTGKREDGFHDIDSVIVRIDWHDLLSIDLRRGDGGVALRVTGPEASEVPTSNDNLVTKAVASLSRLSGQPVEADIWLHKRIPVAAGLAGGSADAAAVLSVGAKVLELDSDSVLSAAAEVGADVPSLLRGGPCRIQGIGEVIEPLPTPELHFVVVVAGTSSTADSYRNVTDLSIEPRIGSVADALQNLRKPENEDLGSSLEGPATKANPALGESVAALRSGASAVTWHLTGSGGALFALVESAQHGQETINSLPEGFSGRYARAVDS